MKNQNNRIKHIFLLLILFITSPILAKNHSLLSHSHLSPSSIFEEKNILQSEETILAQWQNDIDILFELNVLKRAQRFGVYGMESDKVQALSSLARQQDQEIDRIIAYTTQDNPAWLRTIQNLFPIARAIYVRYLDNKGPFQTKTIDKIIESLKHQTQRDITEITYANPKSNNYITRNLPQGMIHIELAPVPKLQPATQRSKLQKTVTVITPTGPYYDEALKTWITPKFGPENRNTFNSFPDIIDRAS